LHRDAHLEPPSGPVDAGGDSFRARYDEDQEETVLFYDIGRVERQIELTPEGRIKTTAIFSYP